MGTVPASSVFMVAMGTVPGWGLSPLLRSSPLPEPRPPDGEQRVAQRRHTAEHRYDDAERRTAPARQRHPAQAGQVRNRGDRTSLGAVDPPRPWRRLVGARRADPAAHAAPAEPPRYGVEDDRAPGDALGD